MSHFYLRKSYTFSESDEKMLDIRKEMSNFLTKEEAMDLFQLPKSLGTYNGEELEVNNGRFGPYVKYGSKFVSLPKGVDALSVELEDAIELIKEKEEAAKAAEKVEFTSPTTFITSGLNSLNTFSKPNIISACWLITLVELTPK